MADTSQALLDLKDVRRRVPFSRSTIYAKIKRGEFPAPTRISENRVAWPEAQIDEWISRKLAAAA